MIRDDHGRSDWLHTARANRDTYRNIDARGTDRIRYNMMFSIIRNTMAILKFRNVEAQITQTDMQSGHDAFQRVVQATLNAQARDTRLDRTMNRSIKYMLLDGTTFSRTAWSAPWLTGVLPNVNEGSHDFPTWTAKPARGRRSQRASNSEQFAALQRIFPRWSVGRETPVISHLDGMDVLTDGNFNTLEDGRWYMWRDWMTIGDVKNLSKADLVRRLNFKDLSGLEGLDSDQFRFMNETGGSGRVRNLVSQNARVMRRLKIPDSDDTVVGVWTIIDRENNKIMRLIPGMDEFLTEDTWDYDFRRPIIQDLKSDFDPDSFWVAPDAAQFVELQKDVDEVVRSIRDQIRKHSKNVMAVRKGAISPAEKQRLARSVSGEFVELKDIEGFKPINFGQVNGDLFQLLQLFTNGMTITGGVSPTSTGVNSRSGTTAREIDEQSDTLGTRMDDISFEIDDFARRNLEGMLDFNQQFMPQDYLIALVGSDAEAWQRETLRISGPNALEGEFRVEISAGSAGRAKKALDRRQWDQFFALYANDPFIDPISLRSEHIKSRDMSPMRLLRQQQDQGDTANVTGVEAGRGGGVAGAPQSRSNDLLTRQAGAPSGSNETAVANRAG